MTAPAAPPVPAPQPAAGSAAEALAAALAARESGDAVAALAAAEAAWEMAGDDVRTRGRAGQLRANLHFRLGQMAAAVQAGEQTLPLLGPDTPTAEHFDLVRTVSLAALESARFDAALSAAQQALEIAQQIEDRGRLALALNALACCFERMGDPWQGERVMFEALTHARASGESHPLLVTLNNLVAVQIGMFHLKRDATDLDEARAPLTRALPLAREAAARAEALGDDFIRVFVIGNLGEVLVHLGQPTEAAPLLAAMEALAERRGAYAQCQRITYTRAEIDLIEGRPEAAWQTLNRVLDAARGGDVWMTRLRLHHALWRCARALGRDSDALGHLEQYLQLERERGLSQLRAQSLLFVTRAEVEQARQDARRDPLTRLGNRREAELRWPELMAEAERQGSSLAVAVLDLDDFKSVNDRHGHATGDAVLIRVAALLRENTRAADLVARTGGEEFLLVLPDTPPGRAAEVCERLRERIAAHDWTGLAPGLAVTVSIGLTQAPPFDAPQLLARADAALYRAKGAGRNRIVVA